MKLSVIIPVYNERGTIARVLELVAASPVEKEIIVIDDGSTDGTREFLESRTHNGLRPFHLCVQPVNAGKGSAIREGLKHVTGDLVIVQDADLELDPADYAALIAPIVNGESEVVFGSRFMRPVQEIPPLILLFNRCITTATNILFGTNLTDEAAGYKVFRTELIKSIPLNCRRFEFCPEVTAKLLRKGHRIVEVPVTYRPRTKRQGKKLHWKDGFAALWTLLRYRFTR